MSTKAEIVLAATDRSAAAFAAVSRHFDNLQAKAKAIKGGLAGVGSALGAGLVVAQGRGLIDMLDGLDDMSEKTGISVEKLSELRYAGEVAGTPIEALSGGFSRLAKMMGEAAGGNKEAVSTFKALGVEFKNADGTLRSTDDVLGDLADRFATYEDGAAKATLAQKIFGKSGAEMLPLLNLGRKGIADLRTEAEQLGAIYGGALAKEAADFNDNLKRLELASQAAAISIGGPLLKSLSGLLNQYIEIKKLGAVGLVIKDIGLGALDPNFSKMSMNAGADIKKLTAERAQLQRDIDESFGKNVGGPNAVAMANRARQFDIDNLNRYIEIAKARQRVEALSNADPNDANDAVSRRFQRETPKVAAPILASGGAGAKAKDPEADAKRYLETLDKQVEKAKDLSQVEITLAEIRRTRAEGKTFSDEDKQRALIAAATIDIEKERDENKKAALSAQQEGQRRLLAMQDDERRIIEATRTPLESYNAALEHLNKLRSEGFLQGDAYGRAIAAEATKYGEAKAQLDELNKHTDDFSKQAAENVQGALGSGLADLLDGEFDNIGKNFQKMLNRMVAEAAAAQIARSMFGDMVSGGSGSGWFGSALSGFGSLFGGGSGYSAANQAGLDGLITGLSGVPKFDVGTNYVPRDMLAMIHEGEAIVPKAYNHGDVGSPAGGMTYAPNYAIQIDARSDKGEIYAGVQRMLNQNNKAQYEIFQRMKIAPQS
ncbi:hypothetical protein [Variovorax sp. UMC13]|uniref:hypothetical protein n=1 Tax=Variovorax sp. UMC13 TaxID=1862326 RepID=UPI001603B471|nr:hypothetical protein [Variovorax sp. UMC13]